MTTVTTTLVSGQNAHVGAVSSRGEYSVSVGSGIQGPTGNTGVSITAANAASGNLVLTFSNTSTIDVGRVVGANGANGANGTAGANGVSVTSANIVSGNLVLTFSNSATLNVGTVVGANGTNANTGDIIFTNTTIGTSTVNNSIVIQTRNVDPSASPAVNSTSSWTFGIDGAITTSDAFTVNVPSGIPNSVSNWVGGGGWNSPPYTNLATTGGTGTGLTVDVSTADGGYIDISYITINNAGTGYAPGDVITINNENNIPGTFTIGVTASTWQLDGGLVFPDTSVQTTAFTGNTGGFEIGYKDVPQNYTNTSFTIALSDRGKHIYTANGTSQTITIANNSSVAFPIGTAISIVSQGAGAITVARGAGVSLYLAANSTSADRSIATYGMASLLKVGTDTWFISGAGVT